MSLRQARVLAAIRDHWAEVGYGPALREIQIRAGISSTSVVAYHVQAPLEQGLIVSHPGKARTIRLAANTASGKEAGDA